MAKTNEKPISDVDLGLEKEKDVVKESVDKTDAALKNAAANAALKAALDANSKVASSEADKTYIIEKKRAMINKMKNDEVKTFVGQKIYANYFGTVFTFLYNTIPVTVRFDGTEQKFPKFICERIEKMISEVSESNTNKVDIEYR